MKQLNLEFDLGDFGFQMCKVTYSVQLILNTQGLQDIEITELDVCFEGMPFTDKLTKDATDNLVGQLIQIELEVA